jgi:predicted lipoprotein with Yx(FWY)xxD motif
MQEAGEEVDSMRRMPFLAILATSALALLALTAGSSAAVANHQAKTVTVSTRNVKGLGQVLVNAKGLTLYMFVPDKQSKVTCVKKCAEAWPPLFLPKGAKAVAAGQAKSSLLGSDTDPAGGHVITYAGWPLYTYVADTSPGADTGQALKLNGGLWYALSPSGKVIKTKPKS